MARFGNIALHERSHAGASFTLTHKSTDSWRQRINAYSELEIVAGSRIAVVRTRPHESYEKAYEAALMECQKGLDLIMMTRGLPLAIEDVDSNLVWWLENGNPIARLTLFTRSYFDTPPASVRVLDKDGNDVTPKSPLVAWDQSFRYYRLSQITSDLTDAYRNMFLMLESFLSDITPKRRREKEVKWLIRALQEAHDRYGIGKYSNVSPGSEGEDLHQDFAEDARHKINHAKRQLTSDLPLDLDLKKTLEEKLERLASICLLLCKEHLKVRRVQGGVFSPGRRIRLELRQHRQR